MLSHLLKLHKILICCVIGWIILVPIISQTLQYRVQSNYIDYILTKSDSTSGQKFLDLLPRTTVKKLTSFNDQLKHPKTSSFFLVAVNSIAKSSIAFKLWIITSIFLFLPSYQRPKIQALLLSILFVAAVTLYISDTKTMYIFQRHLSIELNQEISNDTSKLDIIYSGFGSDNGNIKNTEEWNRYLWITENFLCDHVLCLSKIAPIKSITWTSLIIAIWQTTILSLQIIPSIIQKEPYRS